MAHALLSGYLARPSSPPVAHACLNSACKLRNRFTLETLTWRFELDRAA